MGSLNRLSRYNGHSTVHLPPWERSSGGSGFNQSSFLGINQWSREQEHEKCSEIDDMRESRVKAAALPSGIEGVRVSGMVEAMEDLTGHILLIRMEIKKTVELFQSWQPWQQRQLLNTIISSLTLTQCENLHLILEPLTHRDFISSHSRHYPTQSLRATQAEKDSLQSKMKEAVVLVMQYGRHYKTVKKRLKKKQQKTRRMQQQTAAQTKARGSLSLAPPQTSSYSHQNPTEVSRSVKLAIFDLLKGRFHGATHSKGEGQSKDVRSSTGDHTTQVISSKPPAHPHTYQAGSKMAARPNLSSGPGGGPGPRGLLPSFSDAAPSENSTNSGLIDSSRTDRGSNDSRGDALRSRYSDSALIHGSPRASIEGLDSEFLSTRRESLATGTLSQWPPSQSHIIREEDTSDTYTNGQPATGLGHNEVQKLAQDRYLGDTGSEIQSHGREGQSCAADPTQEAGKEEAVWEGNEEEQEKMVETESPTITNIRNSYSNNNGINTTVDPFDEDDLLSAFDDDEFLDYDDDDDDESEFPEVSSEDMDIGESVISSIAGPSPNGHSPPLPRGSPDHYHTSGVQQPPPVGQAHHGAPVSNQGEAGKGADERADSRVRIPAALKKEGVMSKVDPELTMSRKAGRMVARALLKLRLGPKQGEKICDKISEVVLSVVFGSSGMDSLTTTPNLHESALTQKILAEVTQSVLRMFDIGQHAAVNVVRAPSHSSHRSGVSSTLRGGGAGTPGQRSIGQRSPSLSGRLTEDYFPIRRKGHSRPRPPARLLLLPLTSEVKGQKSDILGQRSSDQRLAVKARGKEKREGQREGVIPSHQELSKAFTAHVLFISKKMESFSDSETSLFLGELVKLCDQKNLYSLQQSVCKRLGKAASVNDLPDGVLLTIFSLLSPADLESVAEISPKWSFLASRGDIWKAKVNHIGNEIGLLNLGDLLRGGGDGSHVGNEVKRIKGNGGNGADVDWRLAYYELRRTIVRIKHSLASTQVKDRLEGNGSTVLEGFDPVRSQSRLDPPKSSLSTTISVDGAEGEIRLIRNRLPIFPRPMGPIYQQTSNSTEKEEEEEEEAVSSPVKPAAHRHPLRRRLLRRSGSTLNDTDLQEQEEEETGQDGHPWRSQMTVLGRESVSAAAAGLASVTPAAAGLASVTLGDYEFHAVTGSAVASSSSRDAPVEGHSEAVTRLSRPSSMESSSSPVSPLKRMTSSPQRMISSPQRGLLSPTRSFPTLSPLRRANRGSAPPGRPHEPSRDIAEEEEEEDPEVNGSEVKGSGVNRAGPIGHENRRISGKEEGESEKRRLSGSASLLELVTKQRLQLEESIGQVALDLRTNLVQSQDLRSARGHLVKSQSEMTPVSPLSSFLTPQQLLQWKATDSDVFTGRKYTVLGRIKPVQSARTLTGHTDAVNCVVFDTKRVFSGGADRLIILWDLRSTTIIRKLLAHSGGVRCLQLDSERNLLFSGSWDETIAVWDLVRFEVKIQLLGRGAVLSLGFDASKTLLVSGSSDGTLRVWSSFTFDLEAVHHVGQGPITSICCDSESSALIGSSRGHLCLYDLRQGCLITSYKMDTPRSHRSRPHEPRSKVTDLVTKGQDLDGSEVVRAHESRPMVKETRTIQDKQVYCTLVINQLVLAGVGPVGDLYAWCKSTGQLVGLYKAHSSPISSLAYCYGRLMTAGRDGMIREWELTTMTCVRLLNSHSSGVTHIQACEAEDRFISCSLDHTLIIWDLRNRKYFREGGGIVRTAMLHRPRSISVGSVGEEEEDGQDVFE